jgi:hypothetical protein
MKAKLQKIHKLRKHISWDKPKIIRFGPKRDSPHAQARNILVPYNEDNPQHSGLPLVKAHDREGNAVTGVLISAGCTCTACFASLRLLSQYNPKRFKELVYPTEIQGFMFGKSLPEHVHVRRRLSYSIGNWRT